MDDLDRKAVQRFRREPGMWEVTEHMTDAEVAEQLRGTSSFAYLRLGVACSEAAEAISDAFRDWSTMIRKGRPATRK